MSTTNSKKYPFTTKGEIRARLAAEPAFVVECAVVLESRTRGRTAGVAPVGVSWGWMSSERVVAGRLVELARAGSISDVDMMKLRAMVTRYSKQIADHLRRETLRTHPELADTARLFSVSVPGTPTLSEAPAPPPIDEGPAESSPTESSPATDEEPAPESDPALEDGTVARVAEALRATPGLRSEELATTTGISTAFLGPVLRQLIDGGQLRRTGAGRGTRYFPL